MINVSWLARGEYASMVTRSTVLSLGRARIGDGEWRAYMVRAGQESANITSPLCTWLLTFFLAPDLPTQADDFVNLIFGKSQLNRDSVILQSVSTDKSSLARSYVIHLPLPHTDIPTS